MRWKGASAEGLLAYYERRLLDWCQPYQLPVNNSFCPVYYTFLASGSNTLSRPSEFIIMGRISPVNSEGRVR
jgi:hypothetical protein